MVPGEQQRLREQQPRPEVSAFVCPGKVYGAQRPPRAPAPPLPPGFGGTLETLVFLRKLC